MLEGWCFVILQLRRQEMPITPKHVYFYTYTLQGDFTVGHVFAGAKKVSWRYSQMSLWKPY